MVVPDLRIHPGIVNDGATPFIETFNPLADSVIQAGGPSAVIGVAQRIFADIDQRILLADFAKR